MDYKRDPWAMTPTVAAGVIVITLIGGIAMLVGGHWFGLSSSC